jgi:filamentous hemagglutinin family protein
VWSFAAAAAASVGVALGARAAGAAPPPPGTLPVPCLGSACAGGRFGTSGFVSAGQATATQAGTKLTVNQTSNNATLNWQSFNIAANGTVQFVQPAANSVALNQINDANASQIFGTLTANGRVFLINQNGIIFGSGAQVNVGGLVASTLNIDPTAVTNGLITPGSNGLPAFQAFPDGTTGGVQVDSGAVLQTKSGGEILVFAPQIANLGTISTPGGQTLLAAGDTIYLASSSDPALRGLLVQVGGSGGNVTNGSAANATATNPNQIIGQIIASDGNVTLAGFAVNQLGRVSATTSINENGTIRLQANDHGTIEASGAPGVSGTLLPGTGGTLIAGQNSTTEVTLDTTDPSTTVDSVPQLKSDINFSGYTVQMLNGSVARATGGTIEVTAEQAQREPLAPSTSDGSRVYIAPGAELDVSGASVVLPVASNVIPVQLRGSELANSPLQQNGPLRSQTVYVDIRQGTPLADISGEIAAIGHNVIERNLAGGTISIQSHGDAIISNGATINVAGGQIDYTGGYLNTSYLLTAQGQIVNIGQADPNVAYAGIANNSTVADPKWGVSKTYSSVPQVYAPSYVEGKDAGSLNLSAPQFIVDGSVSAGTVAGLYQRLPDQSIPQGNLYRPYNQVPQAASLVIGTPGSDFVVGNLSIAPGLVLPGLMNADGSPFNPLTDPLPASVTTSTLRPDLLGSQGFGNVSLYTDGKFYQPANVSLGFPGGGSFSATASVIDIEGGIDIPGGTIKLAAEPTAVLQPTSGFVLTLGPQASLTTRGEWVNDNPLLNPEGNSAPLFINGGSVSLTAQSAGTPFSPGLRLEPGSLIDVSGGAQVTTSGTLNAGVGGSISIGAETSQNSIGATPETIQIAGTLSGYGLFEGGSLSLRASSICVAATDCSGGDSSQLWISPAALGAGGFSSYTLTADNGGLTVAAGTTINLRQENLLLPAMYSMLPDQTSLIGRAPLGMLPDQFRLPVSLSLNQSVPATEITGAAAANTLTVTNATPSLSVDEGALIDADPGAAIALTSNVRIEVDGTLQAPAGTIKLSLGANPLEVSYSPTQAIWLGHQGVLDVAGTARIYPNKLGEPVGSVLAGGTVDITATRGYVEVLPGSLIDVAGSAGVLDVTGPNGAAARAEQVASAGGTVQLTAAEGVVLAGTLEAGAGASGTGLPQPVGGNFSLNLDGSNRNDYALGFGGTSTFPGDPRQVIVSATQAPFVVAPGTAVPDSTAGYAFVSAGALASAGFDTISLRAAPLPVQGGGALPGSIEFQGNVSLSAGVLISLDSTSYSVSAGSSATIRAPYVEFGNSDQDFTAFVPAATPGTGTLTVAGGFIELYGTSALEGIATAQFSSTGDIRLRGLLDLAIPGTTAFTGALSMAGNLELQAQQIYPATLSQFVVSTDPGSVTNPAAGSIIVQSGASPATNPVPFSAGGSMILSAGTVTQDGVLRAPFGAISIDAQSINLSANSLTSTSADGLTIPFGTTQGGLAWVYPLQNNYTIVYGTDGIAPPAQIVTLQGANVNVNKGAVIDVSGGGNLQAYEWIPGPGGTNDVLSNSSVNGGRPNQFAVLPSLESNVASYDPNISSGTTLQVGEAVYLAGTTGLPAGFYQLLPSRYALLPGAFLVSAASGYQDIQPGQSYPVLGGGSIIAGYNAVAGTALGDSRTSGFEVVPAAVVLQQAQYTLTGANQFFSSQAATAAANAASASSANTAAASAVTVPRLPQDSGVLALVASDALTLDGTLRTAAAPGGLGAEVDVSSAGILVAPGTTATQPGEILLTTASLNALGAQTLLLGGLRVNDAIETTAQSVEIASGADLTAPQVLLTAQNQVSVDSGGAITATGTAPGASSYTLNGDGAFLSVSAGPQSTVTRSNSTGVAGVLTLAPGSSISAAGGAVFLDAANNVVTGGTLAVNGADLAVLSPQIILGSAPTGVVGTTLGASVLSAPGLRNLLLASGSAIDFYGTVNAAAQNITLDAPGVNGFGAASDAATLSASDAFKLTNSQGVTAGTTGNGTGSLTIAAPTITLTGGDLTASGFGKLALDASQTLSAAANGALTTAGDLAVTASQVNTAANVEMSLAASGAVSLLAPAKPTAPLGAAPLGGLLSIAGSSIDLATQIVLPSGRVTLTTTGGTTGGPGTGSDLTIDPSAAISVAGVTQQYGGVAVATPGGTVSLVSAGNVTLAAGSTIDVSAASGGQGGSLALSAPTGTASVSGTLKGTGAAGFGASFSIDAQQFGDFGALNQMLNAGSFSGRRVVRLRGAGDLVVASGTGNAVTAANVSLEADQGRIVVDGLIDASGAQGGAVTLAAAGDVIVNGTIDAHASLAGQRGGSVQLETSQGAMLLNAGSNIDVSGGGSSAEGAGGSVLLRVPGATVTDVVTGGDGVALNGTIVGSSRTTLEGFSVYQNATGVISSTDSFADPSNPIYAGAAAFMSNATAITAALGQSTNGAFAVVPGVEIDATVQSNGTGALELDTPWNLFGWRFGPNGTVPGVLTLRAQNGLTFNASLSDGFAATSGSGAFTLPTQPSDSWSYRIVSGADFGAANPLTVDAANPADVTIAACTSGCNLSTSTRGQPPPYTPNMVRTGDGFIDVSASGNFVLGSQASVLYTAGVAGSGILLPGRVGSLQGRAYPTNGGDIQIVAGEGVSGADTNQFVNAWLWRVGSTAKAPTGSATAWTVDFQSFQQGVAALAGGNVTIDAGGDITNLSASIPTIGVQVGGTTYATSAVQVTGGGNLTVAAGGSILGGSYYVGRGSATFLAGADVGAVDISAGGTGLAPIVGLGDATLNVTARGNLALAEILNPTLLNRGAYQGAGSAPVYFSTYGPTSSASLTAIGGTLTLNDANVDVIGAISESFLGGNVTGTTGTIASFDILPPSVNLYALSGDVALGRTLALSPSPTGNLQVFANQNVSTASNSSGSSAQLIVSDADPTQLPSAAAPQSTLQIYSDIVAALTGALPDQHAATPVFTAPDQSGTIAPVRVVALNGSVEFQPDVAGITEGIWSAKPVQVLAGLDVVDLNMVAQNIGPGDVTSVTAGRDIVYPQLRLSNGQVAQDSNGIFVDGPGSLQLTAGRDVDLGTSSGVSTRANLVNPVLPATGASISVNAGIGGGAPQDAAFIKQYVTGSDEFDSNLIAFVESIDGTSGMTATAAKQQFSAFSPELQRAFVEELFFDLLSIYGSKEAATGNGDFSGAFAAITTLFPGANPNLAQKQTNPYSGNIELYFSRIYTEQGGNISLLAPGGEINVGLATAPTSFGINKAADQLGIVAQTSGDVNAFAYNDFQVNQSRVFAADGGNILVWSTEGNIDAGRGAKTAISAPSLNIAYDDNGQPAVSLRAAIAGSGIQALAATPGVSPGNVELFAPHGVVNANDAGIVAGNLTIAATAVLGASNISVSGTSVGVPVTVTGLGASFAGASSTAGAASNVAESFAGANAAAAGSAPVAEAALNWLEVFVTGLGEENCKPTDIECLKRQQLNRSR